MPRYGALFSWISTGLRRQEISGLNVSDVIFEKDVLEDGTPCSKGRHGYITFLTPEARKHLVVVIGTNEAIVKEFMENCIVDSTGTLPAKSIFFAITKQHAKRLWEAFEKLYPEYKGNLARIIVSDDPRAQDILTEFKKENWPRVAISVDMLDTGVDIPEACNLVFAKPIFSKSDSGK